MKTEPILIERTFNAPTSKIWRALTEEEEMKKWYFDIPGFKPEVGYEFQFLAGPPEKEYLHLCKITEVVPERKISYSWRYEGYAGNSLVSFELFDEGDKTGLKLIHDGLETFPADNSDLDKKKFVTGWTDFIDSSLKEYLEKN
jgi:uncharacterized protein YndB with AHSA1/START domain